MLAPKKAIKITQIVAMMFGVGMNFFPEGMMDVYKTLKFGNEAQTMFYFALGIFGVQIMQHAFNCATMSTAGASPKAAGVACLANAAMWFLFAFIDGIRIPLGTLPPFMPKESIMANMVIQCAIGAVNVAGWIGAGKPVALPALPVGSLATPMIAMMANLAFFAIGCAAFTRPFLDMFVPGVMAKFGADTCAAIELIFFNAGVMMLGNTATTMMISNAEPGTPDTNYRLLRANLYAMFFYMGKFSTEAVVNSCTGWPQPMRVSSFVSCFAVLFFAATKFGEYPITVAKTADAKATKKTK